MFVARSAGAVVTRKFERQADEFAIKNVGKYDGIEKFFTRLHNKHIAREAGFDIVKQTIHETRQAGEINKLVYGMLLLEYYKTVAGHKVDQAWHWIFASHPSHEERIAAAQEYRKEHEAAQATA